MAQLSVNWFVQDSIELYVKGRWFSARKDQDFNGKTVKLNSFETFDVGGVYRWKKNELSLQVINVLNRDFEELYGFSVMPRSLFGSYGVIF
jgi:hypothetical protein